MFSSGEMEPRIVLAQILNKYFQELRLTNHSRPKLVPSYPFLTYYTICLAGLCFLSPVLDNHNIDFFFKVSIGFWYIMFSKCHLIWYTLVMILNFLFDFLLFPYLFCAYQVLGTMPDTVVNNRTWLGTQGVHSLTHKSGIKK